MDFNIPEDVLNNLSPETTGKKGKTYKVDERFFRPKLTKENGESYQAKIRFLYKPGSKEVFKPVYNHYFEDYYTDAEGKPKTWRTSGTCLRTFNEKCPCCDSFFTAKKLAESDPLSKIRFDKHFKNRNNSTKYLVNILVIDDKTNPSNNGKVLLWEATPFVYKMVQEAIHGPQKKAVIEDAFGEEDEGEIPTIRNPFHPIEGCDFILRVCKDDKGWTSYANSSFRKREGQFVKSAIAEDDESITAIISQTHDLETALTKVSSEEWVKKLEQIDNIVFGAQEAKDAHLASSTTEGPGFSANPAHVRKQVSADDFLSGGTPPKSQPKEDAAVMDVDNDDFEDPFASPSGSSHHDDLPF